MNRLSNEFDVDEESIRRDVKEDLGLSSYTRIPRHMLTDTEGKETAEAQESSCLDQGKCIHSKILFEKIFTVDQVCNRQTDCCLGRSPGEVMGVFRTKRLAQTISWRSWHPTARRCFSSFLRLGGQSARRPTKRC
uniref:Uncharacterized protein n=1 Tax=Lepeophtheirus salmonis TaxID=72036 RepID=A0A0K2UKJ2_LEPSM